MKCRLQNTPGYWFAFWLMDSNMTEEAGNGAVDGAEIDIMESCDYTGGINHAIHWDGYTSHHQSEAKLVYDPALYEGFHTETKIKAAEQKADNEQKQRKEND